MGPTPPGVPVRMTSPGNLGREQLALEERRVRDVLAAQPQPHFAEFLAHWPEHAQ
jgi:hypothetical protein